MKHIYVILVISVFIYGFTLIGDKPTTPPYKGVYVEWVDIIATDTGWHSKEEVDYWAIHEDATVRQTGFLYKETATYIILIDSFISADFVGAATKIPKGNITKIERW